ncbi:hypothetical protein ACJX0J_028508, partial [Zea mays]
MRIEDFVRDDLSTTTLITHFLDRHIALIQRYMEISTEMPNLIMLSRRYDYEEIKEMVQINWRLPRKEKWRNRSVGNSFLMDKLRMLAPPHTVNCIANMIAN